MPLYTCTCTYIYRAYTQSKCLSHLSMVTCHACKINMLWRSLYYAYLMAPDTCILRLKLSNNRLRIFVILTTLEKSKCHKFISKRRIICIMHSSILRRIWLNFMAQYLLLGFFFGSFTDFTLCFLFSRFQFFRPEHHWRDFIGRNAHLVHQNWYRISFTF
jgi:hypothetical protein